MKILLLISCIAILSCRDTRPGNNATETLPAADSLQGNPAPVDRSIPGDTSNVVDTVTKPR